MLVRIIAILCAVNAVTDMPPRNLQLRQGGFKSNQTADETCGLIKGKGKAGASMTTEGLTEDGMPIFQLLIKEWKKVPDLAKFTERCEKLIGKLMPRLRCEYTALNVPKVLLHDCDVYATKEDYKTNNTGWEAARYNCRYSARRLGEEFSAKQDYKGWCQDLHSYLMEQQNIHLQKAEREKYLSEQDALRKELEELRQQYDDMLRKKGKIAAELDAMGKELHSDSSLKCCPSDCRICTPTEMAAQNNATNKTKMLL